MYLRWAITAVALFAISIPFGLGSELGQMPRPKRVKWADRVIKIALSSSLKNVGGSVKSQSDVNGSVLRALQNWEDAANIQFELVAADSTSISPTGPAGDGLNLITIGGDSENQLAFLKKAAGTSAVTRVFYDARGYISEADIALNPVMQFTTDLTPGTYDLESVLTHEIGHLLGLKHSRDPSAVMFDGVPQNSGTEMLTAFRTLSQDDIANVRALYGVRDADVECCSTIAGKLNDFRNVSPKLVWLQNSRDGSLAQLRIASAGGAFEFSGIASNSYELITQGLNGGETSVAAANPVTATVEGKQDLNVSIASVRRTVSFDLRYIGINGQVSKRALRVARGNQYRMTLCGPGIKDERLGFAATTPLIRIDPVFEETPEFVKGLPCRIFDLAIDSAVPTGVFSIYVQDRSGLRRYIVGAIAVRD